MQANHSQPDLLEFEEEEEKEEEDEDEDEDEDEEGKKWVSARSRWRTRVKYLLH